MRLDAWLVDHKHAQSRARAAALIEAGHVQVNGESARKSSQKVKAGDEVVLLEKDIPYVSRAALKLKAILDETDSRLDDELVLDLGASTGGFVQVALEYGAAHVYAVDVGTRQLSESLRDHPQVTLWENTDARTAPYATLSQAPTVLTADLSFIGLVKVLHAALPHLPTLKHLFVLVKPQFELEPSAVAKGGLVKEEAHHLRALNKVKTFLDARGFEIACEIQSPILGGDGNVEFVLHAKKEK